MRHALDICIFLSVCWSQSQILVRLWTCQACKRAPVLRALALIWAAWVVGGVSAGVAHNYIKPRDWMRAYVVGGAYAAALGSFGAICAYEIWRRATHRIAVHDPGRRQLLQMGTASVIGAPFLLTGFGTFVERTNFRVREIDVPIPGLHPALSGKRLLQLSDIHLSPFLSESEFARVIDASNELRPDIALVTGDLISCRADPLDACLRQLSRLKAPAGTLGCMGNHEHYAAAEDYTAREGARLGLRFLRQEQSTVQFGEALINLAGVDYQPVNDKPAYLRGAEKLVRPGVLNILLSHNPDVFPVAARKGFDLTLAGHTHGGQVTVEILEQTLNVARFATPFVSGYYQNGGRSLYVTRGIGTIGLPARIGAPPEITVLRLVNG
jgi:predicted MPP superfamily phosphohydrolase